MKHKIQNLHENVRVYGRATTKIKSPKSELFEQIDGYQWFTISAYPELEQALFYVPNETQGKTGRNGKITGGALGYQSLMNQAGRSSGVSDLVLLHASKGHHYAVFEMKRKHDGTVTQDEKDFLNYHAEKGAFVCVCFGFEQFKKAVNDYLQ
jgi:hypothetical protein